MSRLLNGFVLAVAAGALLGAPAVEAVAADRDRGRGGWGGGGRDHGRYRLEDRGRSSGRVHSHTSSSHRETRFSLSIGIGSPLYCPPPVYVAPCPPAVVYRPAPVIVHRPAPVIVHQPAPVIVHQPAPVVVHQPQPVQTVIVQQPAPQPVVYTAPAPVTVPATVRAIPAAPKAQVAQPRPGDVVPSELRMSAYRMGDSVMVLINGVNRGGAFDTSLAAGDLRVNTPSVVLYNTPVAGGEAVDTEFEVKMALKPNQPATLVRVLIADRVFDVPVEVLD